MKGFKEAVRLKDATHAVVRFHPQIWRNDYAVTGTDTEDFLVPIQDALDEEGDLVEDNTYDSDKLRNHPNAPEKASEWNGPFYVTIPKLVTTDGHKCEEWVEIDLDTGTTPSAEDAEFDARCGVCGRGLKAQYVLFALQDPDTGELVWER